MNQLLNRNTPISEIQIVPLIEPLSKTARSNLETDFDNVYHKAVGKVLDFKPRILVLGHGPSVRSVTSDLRTLGASIEAVGTLSELPKSLGPSLRAIVVVESMGVRTIVKQCQKLVKKWELDDIPVFAIVPNIKDSWSERKLYKTGVQAVFEWPREKSELPRLVSRMMELNAVTFPKDTEDKALKLAVRTRLLAESVFYSPKRLAIYVYNGTVMLEGAVKSISKLNLLKEKITEMPGVRGVLARSVKVVSKA